MIPGTGAPDRMDTARDQLARTAEASCPGWEISHHLRGWTATRTREQRTVASTSLPGLIAMISITRTAP